MAMPLSGFWSVPGAWFFLQALNQPAYQADLLQLNLVFTWLPPSPLTPFVPLFLILESRWSQAPPSALKLYLDIIGLGGTEDSVVKFLVEASRGNSSSLSMEISQH